MTRNSCESPSSIAGCQHMKPILKKRSLTELMLRRSLSSASLLKDAATMEAQKRRKLATLDDNLFLVTAPRLTRASTTGPAVSNASESMSYSDSNIANKNVRFHDMVEQCIAVAHPGEDDEPEYHYISDSDDVAVVMRKPTKQRRVFNQRSPPTKSKQKAPVSKTIEKLPHAPLKYPLETEEDCRATTDMGLGVSKCPARDRKASPPQSTPSSSGNNPACEDEMDEWEESSWLQHHRDSIQIFHDKLSSINMLSPIDGLLRDSSFLPRPVLERKEETHKRPHVSKGVTLEGRDARISFELLPSRAQLAISSFSSTTYKTRGDEDRLLDPTDNVDKGWAEEIDTSPTSSDYPSAGSDSDSETGGGALLAAATKAALANQLLSDTPRGSSDSGYGSDEAWRVRDESHLRVEKEKAVKDWDIYQDDWDEVDEAAAWQREF